MLTKSKSLFNKSSKFPNKLLISGEHSAVYGGWTLIAPIIINDSLSEVNLHVSTCNSGKEQVVILIYKEKAVMKNDGSIICNNSTKPLFDIISTIFKNNKFSIKKSKKEFIFTIKLNGAPKGTGNSATLSAALTSVLSEYFGNKLTTEKLFQLASIGENGYHGGKASGTDLHAVLAKSPQLFRKVFSKNKVSYQFASQALEKPKDTSLLIVDSYLSGQKTTTSNQIAIFAKSANITKNPDELTESERKSITSVFDKLVMEITGDFYFFGNSKRLGKLFLENQELLSKYQVSSPDIDKVIKISIENGAYGAKLIGAGGVGGAVLVLCPADRTNQIQQSLTSWGFKTYPIDFMPNT